MKICFIEDTDLHGGTQIWVSEAVDRFRELGAEVSVLTSESGWLADVLKDRDIEMVTYDWNGVTAMKPEDVARWARALDSADIGVCTVHPPRNGFHCSKFAAQVIQSLGLSCHLVPKTGTIVPDYKREFYLPDERIASTTVAITKFTRDYLVEEYGLPEEGVKLVYQGTDVALFTPDAARKAEAQTRYPLPSGAGPVLGSVGSFEERKGQKVLLEAVARCREALPGIHLMCVGDGPDEALLRERTRELGLEASVSFFPFTREPVYCFEVMDVLMLPSLYKEGLPNVILEAMSMGLPSIATRLAGIPEVVLDGETGYLTEAGDVQGLADAVRRIWSDESGYQRMAAEARNLMATGFDKRHQFKAFLDCFEEMLRQ